MAVAGGGTDEGRPIAAASLNSPGKAVRLAGGDLIVCDSSSNRVIRLEARSGLVRLVAGNGIATFTGDGGPATLAGLGVPFKLTVAPTGNILIADTNNWRVRSVDPSSGIITTIAGGGGELLADGKPATAVDLGYPHGVSCDPAGDLLVSIPTYEVVIRVQLSTGTVSIVAGVRGRRGDDGDGDLATKAHLSAPEGVAVDRNGNLYIADRLANRIRRVDARSGVITTVIGDGTAGSTGDGGPGTAARLNMPYDVAVDDVGNVFVADYANHRIRKRSADGTVSTLAAVDAPLGLSLSGPDLLVAGNSGRIVSVDTVTGVVTELAGHASLEYDEGLAAAASVLRRPSGLARGPDGDLFVSEEGGHVVRRFRVGGAISSVLGTGRLGFAGDGGPATAARIQWPSGLALDGRGALLVSDRVNHRIRSVDLATGAVSTMAGGATGSSTGDGGPATMARLVSPQGLGLGADGSLLIADELDARVRRVDRASGSISTIAGGGPDSPGDGGPATSAMLSYPKAVCLDPEGDVIVAEWTNRVRRVDGKSGVVSTIAGGGTLDPSDGMPATSARLSPYGITLDEQGRILVAEFNRLWRLEGQPPVLRHVLGTAEDFTSADGGPASRASIWTTTSPVVAADGTVYVADNLSNRIRAVFPCKPSVGSFVPVFPEDGSTATGDSLRVGWGPAESAFRYDLSVDTEFPPRRVLQSDLTGTTLQLAGLEKGKTYYWQVKAKGDPYCPPVERATSIRRFTVPVPCVAPEAPVLVPPSVPSSDPLLGFSSVPGASHYDVLLGAGAAPVVVASGLTSPGYTASGLIPGATYRWRAVAHAACNPELTSSSLEGTFTVPGDCTVPSTPALLSPAPAVTGIGPSPTLTWQPVPGASRYDVHLGTDTAPPLLASNVSGTSLPVSLQVDTAYRWRVVAKTACDSSKTSSSPVATFSTSAACSAPGTPSSLSSTKTTAQLGSTYTLAWPGVEGASLYRVDRSGGDDPTVETFTTPHASLVLGAAEKASYVHHVTALSSCGAASPASPPLSVSVSAAPPHIEMLGPPRATVIAQPKAGLPLPRLEVMVKNTGTTDFAGFFNTSQTVPFFIPSETAISLRAGEIRIYFLQLSGVPVDRAGVYEGTLSLLSADPTDTTAYPQATISLNITGQKPTDPVPVTTAPQILDLDGRPIDFLQFPAPSTASPVPEAVIQVRNAGNVPLDLGADVLPDPWVSIEAADSSSTAWNATPIAPGATRSLRLKVQRIRGEGGGAFPRSTYLTFRTIDGKSSRLLLQDPDAVASGPCRGRSLLTPEESSLIVPSIVNAASKTGGRYVSKLLISNLGPDLAQADLTYTPDTGDPAADGFDCTKVLQATLLVPGLDVVSLTDPLGQLFGTTGSGQLEIRSSRIGQLRAQSVVDAPAPGGGSFGFQLPTVRHGEGARQGVSYSVIGVVQNAAYRTNVILTETSGEQAKVTLDLYDRTGKRIGSADRDLPAYGKTQLAVTELSGDTELDAGAIEVTARDGSAGSVVALTTVIDNRSGDASSFVARPLKARTTSTSFAVPSVVYTTTYQSRLEVRNNGSSPATYRLTYRGNTGEVESALRTLSPRQEDAWENVLRDLLALPPGTFGPLAIASDSPDLQVVSRVYASAGGGTYGDGLEGIALDEPTTTGGSGRMLVVDGLEGTANGDRSRGARTNLILTEIAGKPVDLEVAFWEKSQKRVAPAGTMTVSLGAFEQRQVNDVFGQDGIGFGGKDRLNVLCTVRPKGQAQGRVVALATRIDNLTNDTKNLALLP